MYKFLIIDTYYRDFLDSLYRDNPRLARDGYAAQRDFILQQGFGTADFYSKNLKKLGCEAEEVIANNEALQRQWASENGISVKGLLFSKVAGAIPYARNLIGKDILLKILGGQIKKISPDVLYIQDIAFFPPDFLVGMKKYVKLLVGQIAYAMPDKGNFAPYDLVVSSLPHYVETFRSWGLKSEYFRIGFESSLCGMIPAGGPGYDIVHIGGYGPIHRERNLLLEEVAKEINISFWGYAVNRLPSESRILKNYNGECWGMGRYRIFSRSRMVMTKHITSVAGKYCNNMTLYEATGCGALLVTDLKDNLHELFVPGKEVVAYDSAGDAVEKIKYYLLHEEERKKIAEAGQRRTFTEHTYLKRMEELLGIVKKHMALA